MTRPTDEELENQAKLLEDIGWHKTADGLIGEPHMVQTSYCNGKVISLDLPPYAQKAFEEIMDRQWNAAIEAAAKVSRDCIYRDSAGTGFDEDQFEAAIQSLKKGPT